MDYRDELVYVSVRHSVAEAGDRQVHVDIWYG